MNYTLYILKYVVDKHYKEWESTMTFSIIYILKGVLVQLDLCMYIFTMLCNITFLNVGYKIYCNMYSNLCDKLHIPFITCNSIFKDVHVHVLCINYKAHLAVTAPVTARTRPL